MISFEANVKYAVPIAVSAKPVLLYKVHPVENRYTMYPFPAAILYRQNS